MLGKKRSFFERLTGSIRMEDTSVETKDKKFISYYEEDEDQDEENETGDVEEDAEGQLAVDVYQTGDIIVVKTMTAGVRKEDLEINLSRESITIRGRRESDGPVYEEDYFHRELYWGTFSRTVDLPEEVDIESATAHESHGLLTIKLPKIDKKRKTTIKIQ